MKKKEMTGEDALRNVHSLSEISTLYLKEYESITELLNDPIESVIISGDEIDAYEDRLVFIEKFLKEFEHNLKNWIQLLENEVLRREMLASGQLN